MEHLTGPLSPLSADDVPAIVAAGASWFAEALAELGGSVLARPSGPGAGDVEPLDDDALRPARRLLGGGRPGDGGARRPDGAARRLPVRAAPRRRARPAARPHRSGTGRPRPRHRRADRRGASTRSRSSSGTATASRTCSSRTRSPSTTPRSTCSRTRTGRVRVRGGAREIPRWFAEPGADGGLVDFPAVTRALLGRRLLRLDRLRERPEPAPRRQRAAGRLPHAARAAPHPREGDRI